jgi:hypothetical protein
VIRKKTYTVQPATPVDGALSAKCTTVLAAGPIDAAETVLGERLVTRRDAGDLRARVWEMRDDLTPSYTLLYRESLHVPRHRANSTARSSAATQEETSAFTKLMAITCAVAALSLLILGLRD